MKKLEVIRTLLLGFPIGCLCSATVGAQSDTGLTINELEYFETPGLNVMVFHDYYPGGRQGGITIVQNGIRVASNGNINLEPSARPYPDNSARIVDLENKEIQVKVAFTDSSRNNLKDKRYSYPDLRTTHTLKVKAEGKNIRISVDLDQPIPEKWQGKVVFNLELFPGQFFDQTFYMDAKPGLFPRQPNGPMSYDEEGELRIEPIAVGRRLVVLPESADDMIVFESLHNDLILSDGRGRRNAGWFLIRSPLRAGVTKNAIEWLISPSIRTNYEYQPVIQVSQVGYHPDQRKVAVVELDKRTSDLSEMALFRISESGGLEAVQAGVPEVWGEFLRYKYAHFDFSQVKKSGMYVLEYGDSKTHPFMIDAAIYDRHIWQPTLEYYLPVQMCHMRVNDRVKVWHGLCHEDDALMAPVSHFHFDGYKQGPSTLTEFKPADPVPGLNVGGWHDAGDYDLRVESQAQTVRMLAYAWELFRPEEDETTVDQANKLVEIHRPDGIPDILQQIEHGVLTINGGYKALGRLYRGIICPTGRQYSLLGDGTTMTDNLIYQADLDSGEIELGRSGIMDDRWVFTEENPRRELHASTCLATAYRSLKDYNPNLAKETLDIAQELWEGNRESDHIGLIDAATELFLSTGDQKYKSYILSRKQQIVKGIQRTAPAMARIASEINDQGFMADVEAAVKEHAASIEEEMNGTPYGVRYTPRVWGAGWDIQRFGVNQYFLHKGFPEFLSAEGMFNSLNFVLGVHPGINTASFVSGVGSKSLLVAYGVNRDDWSYIPGGSASGTALIRPDLPELKEWPYLWQQTEYVMGGGAMNYMFMVLAAQDMLKEKD